MPKYNYSYPSFAAFIDAMINSKPLSSYYYDMLTSNHHGEEWSGGSYQNALNLVTKGWPEGLAHMVEATANAAPLSVMVPTHTMDVAGHYPIAAIAASGDPMNMVFMSEIETKTKPIVKLGVNIWLSSAYKTHEIINYGAAILSYIDALETASIRVELYILMHGAANRKQDNPYTLEILAKKAEDHMELDKLAFMLAHPSMLRRFCFGHIFRNIPNNENCLMPRAMEARDDMLTLSGLNTMFSPHDPRLNSPKEIVKVIGPAIDAQLSALGHTPPEIIWGNQ